VQVEYSRVHMNGSLANGFEDNGVAVGVNQHSDFDSEPVVIRGGGDVTHSEARTGLPPAGSVSAGGVLQGMLSTHIWEQI
jgi:hypothetical protein